MKPVYQDSLSDKLDAPLMLNNLTTFLGVQAFLRAIEKEAPGVLKDLKNVRDLYTESVRDELINNDWVSNGAHLWRVLRISKDLECQTFVHELDAWALKYHLVDKDFGNVLYLNVAIAAISGCIQQGQRVPEYPSVDEAQKRELSLAGSIGAALSQVPTFSFGLDADDDDPSRLVWNPLSETWGEFESRVKAIYEFNKAIYRDLVERIYNGIGFEQAKEKREESHFVWFVQYQVMKMSKYKIAKVQHVTQDTVRLALRDVADRLRLPLQAPDER